MHRVVVCVASNTEQWCEKINDFIARVRCEIDSSAIFSPVYSTISVTDGTTYYHNMVCAFKWMKPVDELSSMMKCWEQEAGREAGSSTIPIDIDVVVFDKEILRPKDFNREYFQIGYKALDQG